MTQQEQAAAERLVRDMIAADPSVTNGAMAEAASARLGRDVSAKNVSRLRNKIGLGVHGTTPEDLALAGDARSLARLFAPEGSGHAVEERLAALLFALLQYVPREKREELLADVRRGSIGP